MTNETDGREQAYAFHFRDSVRDTFEQALFARLVPELLSEAGGGRLLDLGCADGLGAELAGDALESYLGVDLAPHTLEPPRGEFLAHDLREGLGPVGDPHDVYLASFGVASHLTPAELSRLVTDIAAHARPGAIVALEALGLYSLEWPKLWDRGVGEERTLAYQLASDVDVHPWAPGELMALIEQAGLTPLRALDRTVQAGPKLGQGHYWPGLPPIRATLNGLLEGDADDLEILAAGLPPLPAHPAAEIHHRLAAKRRRLLPRVRHRDPEAIARAIWALEPASAGGYGHGLLVVGRVP